MNSWPSRSSRITKFPVVMDNAASVISLLTQAIGQSLDSRFPAYAFRLPGETTFYWGSCSVGDMVALSDEGLSEGQEGFLFAPFDRGEFPSLFFPVKSMPAESIDREQFKCHAGLLAADDATIPSVDCDYTSYSSQAQMLIEAMIRGELRKAVLSRTVTLRRPTVSDAELFLRLAAKYPMAFVSWVHLPGRGRWIGATPETLLDYDGRMLSTMALAGTRKAGAPGEWGQKELEEQQIVTDSIVAALKSRGLAPVVGDRFTRVAAQVEHLCTPISAEVRLSGDRLNEILCALHPTPAVGGYPKAEAKAWIDRVEPHRRRYYGGYLGPVRVDGVRLFVNLRCLEANNSLLRLYVGGGLTAQSQPASEWCETEAKAQTLLSVING